MVRPKNLTMLHRKEHPRQPPVLERAVSQFWRDHGASLPTLECDDGSQIRVIYPGRSSAAAGPDFRDAILQRPSGEVLRGDVEIHLRKGGWEAHSHGIDHHYNNVVPHVTLHQGAKGITPTRLASGVRVPTAALFPRTLSHPRRSGVLFAGPAGNLTPAPTTKTARVSARPLPLAALHNVRLETLLDRAGDARFLEKSRRFRQFLSSAAPGAGATPTSEDVLYQGLMTALGYGGNSEPFLRLAQGMPLRAITRMMTGVSEETRSGVLASLLLQASGLPITADLSSEPPTASPVVSPQDWHLFRVRPSNHPSRRIMGVAELLHRSWDMGMVDWATALVSTGNVGRVKQALTVAAHGEEKQSLIGGSRAADIAVNVVLPFVHAWGIITTITNMVEGALLLYQAWPPLQENALTVETLRVISSKGAAPSEPMPVSFKRTARRQQGLIHLYKKHFQAPKGLLLPDGWR